MNKKSPLQTHIIFTIIYDNIFLIVSGDSVDILIFLNTYKIHKNYFKNYLSDAR